MHVSSPIASFTRTTRAISRSSMNPSTSSMIVAAMESSCIASIAWREQCGDLVQPRACLATCRYDTDGWLERVDIIHKLFHVHAHGFGKVDLVDHDDV